MKPNIKCMQSAICEARKNLKLLHGGPFGACIVKNNKILAVTRNTVLINSDPTCHAEINAIRIASKKIGNHDLSGCVIYSTTEPCPMCFSAIHWAKIDEIVYGTLIQNVKKLGFNELSIPNQKMKSIGKSKVKITKNFLKDECMRLLKDWSDLASIKIY